MSEDKKYKILIVDDEPDNLALLYRTLRHNYDVVKSGSPLEALKILEERNDFALILSDHKMPEMDGVEFLKRTNAINETVVKILVTAYSDAKILIDAINRAKVYRYVKKPYSPDELLHVVQTCLEYYQLKVDNDTLIADLKDLFSGTIKAIIEALDAKDANTLGRSKRVSFYSAKIAQAMQLSNSDVGRIELAGLLHDIGMIGVAEEIMHKTDQLTPEEYEEVKKHVAHSIKILEDIKQLGEVIEIVRYHHEYYDGSGYPKGLKGEQIPIGARIIAVADAYDALVSKRAYRDAKSYSEALVSLEEAAGVQLDPNVVKVFKEILPEANEMLEVYVKKMSETNAK